MAESGGVGAGVRSEARFTGVMGGRGHYESFYLKACHPEEPVGVWVRYTVHKRPGEGATGSVWFTLFDGAAAGPLASKATVGAGEVGVDPGEHIRVGESAFAPGRAVGSARSDRLDASWELSFETSEPPLRHLPREWMYRAPIPRTKLLSPYPAALFSGRVRAGERELELEAWPGMVGHNWGAQHAERWIWLHGTGFEGRFGSTWLDAAIGRIKLGPLTTPWIANGVLCLDGERHRLGGPERVRGTKVRERPDGCDFVLPGKGISVSGRVEAPRKDFVCWVYADPDGPEHNTANCSICDMELTVSRPGRPDEHLRVHGGAAYELGMRERDHGFPVQPFTDP